MPSVIVTLKLLTDLIFFYRVCYPEIFFEMFSFFKPDIKSPVKSPVRTLSESLPR